MSRKPRSVAGQCVGMDRNIAISEQGPLRRGQRAGAPGKEGFCAAGMGQRRSARRMLRLACSL
jgi:hypothetical protein